MSREGVSAARAPPSGLAEREERRRHSSSTVGSQGPGRSLWSLKTWTMIAQAHSIASGRSEARSAVDVRRVAIGGDVWRVQEEPRTALPSYGRSLTFDTELIARRVGTIRRIRGGWRMTNSTS